MLATLSEIISEIIIIIARAPRNSLTGEREENTASARTIKYCEPS
jgi:hypothetical protein